MKMFHSDIHVHNFVDQQRSMYAIDENSDVHVMMNNVSMTANVELFQE
jgi:hypothetical protein